MVVEAAVVIVVGFALALAANQVSPRGLTLSRNYFPKGTNTVAVVPKPKPPPMAPAQAAPVTADDTAATDAADLSERLRGKGLQELKRIQTEALFHDAGAQDGRIIFVDARDEDHYQDGHLPGAYELDPYHPEKELGPLLNLCQAAEKIVVYCTGGECEDSDTAAILLRDGGVPNAKIFVYGGGFTEWEGAHLPLETGARNSGQLIKSP